MFESFEETTKMEAVSRPIQILLADDDADDREFFEEALMEVPGSAKLTTVEDGQKLLDFLSKIENPPPPDLIFLDINMPVKTGKACLKEIRGHQRYRDIPIIMFSTSSQRVDIEETYSNGANLYISKSIFFEDDVNILKRLISLNWKDYMPRPDKDKFVLVA